MAINYFDSSNRYTDPVRYFKANDPYYFEVDNIPVKQLEENSKFLKDQVDGLLKRRGREILLAGQTTTLDRVNFNELKPFVDNTGSKVKVMPGRFTARINDAYTQDPLQFITQIFTGPDSENTSKYQLRTAKSSDVAAALDQWKSKTASNATLMNGLFERVFVYGMKDIYTASEGVDTGDPNTAREPSNFGGQQTFWPGFIGMVHEFREATGQEAYTMGRSNFLANTSTDEHFRITGRLESEFIKRWRGVTRTSIVDVKEVLEIDIPAFDPQEFFYVDENGQNQTVAASQRIDLLFIYSKAVDQSDTTIPSYAAGGSPRTITEPTLGIVKGAGLGVKQFEPTPAGTSPQSRIDLQSIDGVTLMIPNSSDELAENTGFNTSAGSPVRGSFPSPDDLMNLAPLLAETLSTTSVSLVGQSILPVAYIVVKESPGFNSLGEHIVTEDDIIDIRPFFRTTELAYNERAGIAAATPQISIANPVVSEAHLDFVKKDINDTVDGIVANRIDPIQSIINNLKVNKVFMRNVPANISGLNSKRMNTFNFSNYTEFDITDAVGGRVDTTTNPYKLKGVYFQATYDQGFHRDDLPGSVGIIDSNTFDFRLSHESTTAGQASRFRTILTAGGQIESGKLIYSTTNHSFVPVRVAADGRVYIYLKPIRVIGGKDNDNDRHSFSLKVTGFMYEPNSTDITYEIPNGAM
jgi:hypothetical protein